MPRNVGGSGMPDLDIITQSMRIGFVDKVISQPDTKWKLFPRIIFRFFRFSFQNKIFPTSSDWWYAQIYIIDIFQLSI